MCTIRLCAGAVVLAGVGLGPVACVGPFDQRDFITWAPSPEKLQEIEAIRFEDRSRTPPVSVEDAVTDMEPLAAPSPPETLELALAEVRAAALESNLDLHVELINPTLARLSVDEEEAKFESVFTGSARRSITDSPTPTPGIAGSNVIFNAFDLGVRTPLRTGGQLVVDVPFNRSETNNPFSVLNPAFDANVRFSISQPLLRGAGNRTNTHSIRVVKRQRQITDARTKLEAIRILAAADRAYWSLYAAQRELEVRRQQYELAATQLERARRLVEAGAAPEIEILRAQSGLAQRVEGIIIARNQVRRSERDLKRVMNRPDVPMDSPTAVALSTVPDPVGLDLDPEALAAFALENRMDMLELELQLAIDASTIDFERNNRLPLVTLDYTYNLNGLDSSFGGAFDQVRERSFEDHSVGLTAEVPLGNEAAEARVHRAILQRVQRLATREQRRLAIRQEVYDAADQLGQNWQRILAARQDAILAGETYEAEQRQFDVGARTSTDVLDAATRLADAQSREILALTDYQIAQIDLAFATGTLLGYDRIRWEPGE